MIGSLSKRFNTLTSAEQGRWFGFLLCCALYLLHYTFYSFWYVEDAAISFSFARNFAAGDGFVPYPGGTPVEGFSNPTWTLLLALLSLGWISPWVSAKLLGMGLGLSALAASMRWGRHLLGDKAGLYLLLPPFLLAISPQFVLWNASGLENPLFVALLAWGSVLLLDELQSDVQTWPKSALLFGLLAITRPEAPLYLVAVGLVAVVGSWRKVGAKGTLFAGLRWILIAATPLLIWQLTRHLYFGWPLPNTYYAKLVTEHRFYPLEWESRGWLYLRKYALSSALGFTLPLFVISGLGVRGRRGVLALVLSALLWFGLLPTADWPMELVGLKTRSLSDAMVYSLVGLSSATLLLPLLIGIGRERHLARSLTWLLALTTLFFCLYTGGDWMKGFRWLSLAIVPITLLFADGAMQLDSVINRTRLKPLRSQLLTLSIAVPTIGSLVSIGIFMNRPETTPFDVYRRVVFMQNAQDRLHLDRPSLLEVDMGAHMWWSGFELVDMAGLVDVPIGHLGYDKPFIREYVFKERNPTFAHVHGGWARKTKMKTHKGFKRYLNIGAYPVSPWTNHPGSHIRRDLFTSPRWEGTKERRVRFDEGVSLAGWDIGSTEVAAGGVLYVEVGYRKGAKSDPFRVVLFLANESSLASFELPPGYDWLPNDEWKANEIVIGRHTLTLPNDLAHGSYDLGFAFVGEDGVMSPATLPKGTTTDNHRFASGEVRWSRAIEVVPTPQVDASTEQLVTDAIREARKGECANAVGAFDAARRRVPFRGVEASSIKARVGPDLSTCLATIASSLPPEEALQQIESARWYHSRGDVLAAAGQSLATQFKELAAIAIDNDDPQTAHELAVKAAEANPTDARYRRYVEEQRASRLREQRVLKEQNKAEQKARREALKNFEPPVGGDE